MTFSFCRSVRSVVQTTLLLAGLCLVLSPELLAEDGQGVTQDYAKAVELYKKACDGGEMPACFSLGYQYQYGICDGVLRSVLGEYKELHNQRARPRRRRSP